MRSLSCVIHGEPGVGKSWVGDTAPAYRLVLDAEGGSRFTPSTKTYWNPAVEPPPEPGVGRISPHSELIALDWHTCIVQLVSFDLMERAYQWLAAGSHPFRSVVIDSLTELQKKVIDQTTGISRPTQADWGDVLRTMETNVRQMRDLLFHPTRPLECVCLVALTHNRDGKFRPFVKGQLELTLPGYIDLVGYLYVENGSNGELVRKMLVQPLGDYDAKDRTNAVTVAYGPVVANPNLEQMIQVIDLATTPQPAAPAVLAQ